MDRAVLAVDLDRLLGLANDRDVRAQRVQPLDDRAEVELVGDSVELLEDQEPTHVLLIDEELQRQANE